MIKIKQMRKSQEKEEDLNLKYIKLPNVQNSKKTNSKKKIISNKKKTIHRKNNNQSLILHFKKGKKY